MGLPLTETGPEPVFAQIYVMGDVIEAEASHRKAMSRSNEIQEDVINDILDFFYEFNPYAIQFTMSRQILEESQTKSISLMLKSVAPTATGSEGHERTVDLLLPRSR
ncbi:uncharacterized protein MELLADRAFT_101143 [Melampsora larici-populina 98AG31]|uniref:Uncharacterized protein n=1 Tax=Melampsora larici-populina (strain 98AG31 / pathotype 3-4-7) TaxID=747676 RepID=F4R3R9_MELLP|nr:uncharacterized protein MELLADRAFT_101143 [Melampsora larici-populina 98AG31]EGG12675.1 hypothetical protein MELLADRAFT_101143 [Melampsora larici-populina 98AG31]